MKATVDTFFLGRVRSKRGLGERRLRQIEAILPPIEPSKRADLWNGLNTAFYAYWYERNWRAVPPVSEIEERLAAIASTARRLLRHLRLGEQPRPFGETVHDLPYLLIATLEPAVQRHIGKDAEYRTFEKLNETVEGVQKLVAWADDAILALKEGRDEFRIRRRPAGPGTRDDEALDGLIRRLGKLYGDATGHRPGISRSAKGKPGGPFFRFVLAFCAKARIRITVAGLEKRWRRLRHEVHASDRVLKKSEPTHFVQ
jgi:hypothetical protein